MVKRVRPKQDDGGGNYFAAPKTNLRFIHSGSKMLDLALGGGWVFGRIANIVGDKSTGKTLLMIEACANFHAQFPKGKMFYREAESAFDPLYARTLGMPVDDIDFGEPLETVEDMFEDLERVLKSITVPGLYIVDSLDALSDRGELDRAMDQGTYGAQKAKNLSQLFRRLVRRLEQKQVTVLIVSQVRDKIGAMFGPKTTRSGGRALDFYASQVVYLNHMGRLAQTIRGQRRAVGVKLRAKLEKNKVALPFREAAFNIQFGFGVDDAESCLSWLKETKYLGDVGLTDAKVNSYLGELADMPMSEYRRELADLHAAVTKRWYEIEKSFLPKRTKYGEG